MLSASPARVRRLPVATSSANSLAILAGDGQTIGAGTAVAVSPTVKLLDQFGNAMQNRIVTFAVTAGGGRVSDAMVSTGADGKAAPGSWTLGGATGGNALRASVGGLSVTFHATARE